MKFNVNAGVVVASTVLVGAAVVAEPAAALTINVNYEGNVTGTEGTEIEYDFNKVVAAFDAAISNPVTIDLDVALGALGSPTGDKTLVGGDISQSSDQMVYSNYTTVSAAMRAVGDVIPGNPSSTTTEVAVPNALNKVLNLGISSTSTYDAYIGFSGTTEFSFGGTIDPGMVISGSIAPGITLASTIAPSTYSFIGDAEHEISEALGRTSYLNSGGVVYQSFLEPLDLLRYTAPGIQNASPSVYATGSISAVYLSTNGGTTDLGTVNEDNINGDLTDWQDPSSYGSKADEQDSNMPTGIPIGLSISDADVLVGLGYDINNSNSLFSTSVAPTGVSAGLTLDEPQPAPEPASLSVLAVGAALTRLVRRRRRVVV